MAGRHSMGTAQWMVSILALISVGLVHRPVCASNSKSSTPRFSGCLTTPPTIRRACGLGGQIEDGLLVSHWLTEIRDID